MSVLTKFTTLCKEKNIKLTDQRKIIAQIIDDSNDHPDIDIIFARAKKLDNNVSIATVYRTIKLLEEEKIIEKHDFRDGKSHYETSDGAHHDHLINIITGNIIEFHDEELEKLKEKIAEKLGYKLVDHRLELYAVPLKKE